MSRLGAAGTRRLGWESRPGFDGECALCAFLLCKSCFIRDIDLQRPMAALLAVHALRALSWTYALLGSRWKLPHATAEVDIPNKARFT